VADLGFMGHEAYTSFGTHFKKIKQNYEYKIRYESEYLFRMRKEITINFKFKKADQYHKHNKIQKNNVLVLLISCLEYPCNTFFLHFFKHAVW
jgi:hypothetical protein